MPNPPADFPQAAHTPTDISVHLVPPGAAPTRNAVKVLEPDGTLVGFCLADVRWTRKLSGDELDSVVIPREYMLSDGTLLTKLAYIDQGWYLEWDGYRYVVDTVDGDLDAGLTIQASDAAWSDLSNVYCAYSPGPATFLNQLPSRIGAALVSGRCGREVRNPGFGILGSDNLPTNWTHPVGWTSELVENRRVWQAAAGSAESASDDRPCTPGISYQVVLDASGAGPTGARGVKIRWRRTDGSTVDSAVTSLSVEDGASHELDTGPLVAQGIRMQIVLVTTGTTGISRFDDVRLYEIGPDTGYVWDGTAMDTRAAAVPYTDGAWQKYGVWTDSGTYLEATVAGDYIGRVFNGPFVTVSFAAGGTGAQAKVRVNGVQYQQSGSSLVRGGNAINVSAAVDLTLSGLDPANDHMIEIEAVAVRVRFAQLAISTANLVGMRFDATTSVYEALAALQKAVGGEIWFDPVAKVVHHVAARGQDLRDAGLVEFRKASGGQKPNATSANIVKMSRRRDRAKIVNRLTGLGYGEGEYQLVVTVDATGAHPTTGLTSTETFGVRRGTYTDKNCKSVAAMTETLLRLVEESAWEAVSYDVEVLDSAAALVGPGDTGHFVYEAVNESLRILEVTRDTDGGAARLVVGGRKADLADLIVPSTKQLATLNKSFQGVPADTNDSFSDQFERTADGVDVPAEVDFFVPYGADLIDLRLRYQIGGMRSFAKAVAGGGAGTTPSGGGSTSGSGGSSAPTSSSVDTPSGGGATTPSGGGATAGAASLAAATMTSVTRNPATSDFWYEVILPPILIESASVAVTVQVGNFTGGTRSFDYAIYTAANGGGVQLMSGSLSNVPDNGYAYEAGAWSTNLTNAYYLRMKMTTAGGGSFLFSATRTASFAHTHVTPNHTHSTPAHTHPSHSHTVSIGAHYHATPNHTHTIPDHTHGLSYGIYQSAAPTGGIRVYLDGALITPLNGLGVVSDFDLLPYIGKDSNGRVQEGWHTLKFSSATTLDTGSVRGTVFARKFLATEGV